MLGLFRMLVMPAPLYVDLFGEILTDYQSGQMFAALSRKYVFAEYVRRFIRWY